MRLDHLPPFVAPDQLRVVIETPRGSRHKYAYEPEVKGFVLRKSLPEGMVFPFDFGFIPCTEGEDGDPLDVLVLADAPMFAGCIASCRIIGVIEAEQREERGGWKRNDRFLAVTAASLQYKSLTKAKDLPPHLMEQIEQFFVSYNRMEGKQFRPLQLTGPKAALKRLKAACESLERAAK